MVAEEDSEFDDFMLDILFDAQDVKNELCAKVAQQHESRIAENGHPWSHYVIGRMLFEGVHPFHKNAHKAFVHMTIAAEKKIYEAYWYLSQMYGYRQQKVLAESTVKLVSSHKAMLKIQLRMWAKSAIAGPYFYSFYSLKQFSDDTKSSALAANAYCEVISKLCTKINVFKLCNPTPTEQLGQHYFELACLLLYTDVDDEGFAKRVAIRLKMSKIARELHDGNIDRDWTDHYDDIKKILPAVTIECLIKAGENGCPAGFYYLRYLYCQDTQLILSPEANYHAIQFPCQVEENRTVAFTYLKRAASGGHPMAQYEIIIRGDSKYPYRYLFAGISLSVLSTYLESLCNYGYKQILLLLATCYFRGVGITRDKKRALDSLEEMLLAPNIVYFPNIIDQTQHQELSQDLLEHNIYGIAGYQSPTPVRCFNGSFDKFDYLTPYHYFLLAFFYERGLGITNQDEKAASFYRLSYELIEKFCYNDQDHFVHFYGISRGYSLLSLCRIGKMIEGEKIDCDNLTLAEECYRRALTTHISTNKVLQFAYAYYRLGKFYSNPDHGQYRSLAKSYYNFDEVLCVDPNQPDLFRNYCSYYMGKIYDQGLGGGEVNHRLAAMNYSGLAGVINAHFHPYCDIYFTYMQQKAKTRIKSEVPLEILQKGKNVIATYEKACKYGTSTMDVVRVLIFGVENVGKTSLLKSLIGEETKTDQLPTIDIDTSRSVDSSDWDADGNIKEGCRYDVERDVSTGSGYNTDSDEEVVMAAGKRNGVIENGDTMHSGNQIQNHSDEDKNNKNISHKSDKSQTQQGVKNDANSGHLFIEAGISGGKGLLKTVLRKGMAEKLRATLQQASDKQKSNAKQSDEQRSRSRSLQTKSKSKKHRSTSAHEMPSEPRERKYSLQGNIRSNSRGNNDRCKTPPLTKEESGMQLKFWDFSDSFEYYTTKLSSRSSIYILVFNAAKHIEEMIEKRDGSHDIYTYLDKMTTWLQSIHLHTLREEDCILGNDLSFSPPAIILVGTHGDEIQIENEEERTNKINQISQAESKESGKETNAKGRHKDKAKYYYAPCTMSNISLPTDEELYPQDCIQSVWLKIKFKDEIPDITFYRLLTCCLRKWNTNPKLYRNCVIYSIATQVSLIIKKEGIHVGLQILFRPVNKNESKREIDDKMITNGIGIAARVHVEKQLVKLLKKWNASMKKQYSLYFLCPCICQTNQDHLDDEMKQKVCNNFINLGNVINTLEASKDQKIQYKDIHCDNCNQAFSSMNYLKFWFKLPDENLQ
ncbi:uncharacterized protein TRIADDRAFT_55793 [Trichoplax adhaerens]|uniref:Roc domain-containing protein n=1 Tax=Trichoplax adhaerens TaxID=10228 RepID=B3RVV7_TRIAD|nr:predicted protein [Trichoplax adhaerens]EDV25566.1 predicted protein [Trichoplax adhaerens]|eukprot:XP_002111599.1 predicted protein [Trichoplax adhaerens]